VAKDIITAGLNAHAFQLLQLRELCLGFLQDGNVRVGVFPEVE